MRCVRASEQQIIYETGGHVMTHQVIRILGYKLRQEQTR